MSEELNKTEETVVDQQEGAQTEVKIEGNNEVVTEEVPPVPDPLPVDQEVVFPMSDAERELALLELSAIVNMMAAQYEKPDMRNRGTKGAEFKGTYTTVNIYELTEIIALKERADELCQKLGINLKYQQKEK